MYKRKIASKLDQFCQTILDNTQILKKIHQLKISLQEKSRKILMMLADGYFTSGSCRDAAEQQVRLYMRQSGFTEGLISGMPRKQAEQELINFRELLERAEIRALEDIAEEPEDDEEEQLEQASAD